MTTRRQFLRGAAATAGLLWMPAVVTRAAAQTPVPVPDGGPLSPERPIPDFDALARYARYAVGVRPHRKGGIRLELMPAVETAKGTKFVIHNYGHSGAGITLSWGCASYVVQHVQTAMEQMQGSGVRPSVAVIGSGVIGLTSATELRRRWPRLPISVYAKSLDVSKTTSFIAGGQFEPSQIWREYTQDKATLADYLRRSAARVGQLQNSGRRQLYGVAMRKNYTLDYHDAAFSDYTPCDVVPAYRQGTLPFKSLGLPGREYTTWLMNPKILLPRLIVEGRRAGVTFKAKTFGGEQELYDTLKENIIVNCTGYGAKALFGDGDLSPRRGHLVVLNNPDPGKLNYFFSGGSVNDANFYLFARQTDIVIGGTVQHDDDREDPVESDKEVFDRLLDNARRMFGGKADQCVDALDGTVPVREPDKPEGGRCLAKPVA